MSVKPDTVKAIVNGQEYQLTRIGSTDQYTFSPNAPSKSSFNEAGGYFDIQIIADDVAGNRKTLNSATEPKLKLVVKSIIKPVVTIIDPGASATLTSNKPPITFQLRDSDSGIKISTLALKINGGTAIGNAAVGMTCTPVAGGYDVTYVVQTALSDGTNSVTIDVQNNDGLIATTASRSFKVDTVPPTLNVTSPADALVTNANTVNVIGITNDATSSPVTVKIKLNGTDQGAITVDGSGNFNKSITLVAGANTIEITSTDAASRSTVITRTVTQDKVAPVISGITIAPNPVDAGATYVITVIVTDA